MAKRGGFRKGDFMLISQSGLSALQQEVRGKRLGVRELRVFFEMLANAGYDNVVTIGQGQIGQLTGMDLASVSRCSKTLLEHGFIERFNDRRGWYRIAPKFAWKGGGEGHREVLARQAEEAYLEVYRKAAADKEVA